MIEQPTLPSTKGENPTLPPTQDVDPPLTSTKSVTTSKFKENYLTGGRENSRYKSHEHTEEEFEFDGKYSNDDSGSQTEKFSCNASR